MSKRAEVWEIANSKSYSSIRLLDFSPMEIFHHHITFKMIVQRCSSCKSSIRDGKHPRNGCEFEDIAEVILT